MRPHRAGQRRSRVRRRARPAKHRHSLRLSISSGAEATASDAGAGGKASTPSAAKLRAAFEANAAKEHVMQYNARKQQVTRDIYHRAFTAAGLLGQ